MKEKVMRMGSIMSMVLSLALVLAACSTAPMSKSDIEEKRDSVRAMASKTLADLEKKNPEARTAISDAAGYAVFSDVGLKIIYMGTAKGGGIAVNNKTKQETFMKMFELQPGLGLGAEKYRVVFVFETPEAFNSFVTSGREIGADAMAAAKNKTKGGALAGAVTLSKDTYMFQVDTEGAIVGVSLTGAKFYKDKELN
ncbi:MAG: lipid-binding SYLF domain-containing protein [Candidatus Deferrimicrobiaceae bacterium]